MKKAFFLGSLFCVFLGIVALVSAFFVSQKTTAIILLLAAYFVGTPILFSKVLPRDEKLKITENAVKFVYGKRFWVRIFLLMAVSLLLSIAIYHFLEIEVSAFVLVFLGLSAVSTAFISPSVEDVKLGEEFF